MQALVFDPPRARWPLTKLAGWIRSASLVGALGGLRLRDVSPPALPGPDWVRLRTRLGGICGTDLALVTLRNHPATLLQRFASFPAVLGHENVAVIEEMGPQVRGWQVGQRVCVEPSLSCAPRGIEPSCSSCRAGRVSLCENTDRGALPPGLMIGLNSRTGGSWSETFVAHVSQLHAVPDAIPDPVAVLADPVACSLHALLRRPPAAGENVLIAGSGVMAVGVLACLRAAGHRNRVVCVVRHGSQADRMRRHGADDVRVHPRGLSAARRYADIAAAIGGRNLPVRFGNQAFLGGFDLTYDCIGTGQSLTDALKWTAPRGTVALLGTSQITVVDTTPLWFREVQVIGCNGRQVEEIEDRRIHTYDLLFEWLVAGRLNLSGWLTHEFELADYRNAFARLVSPGRGGIFKAAFRPGASP